MIRLLSTLARRYVSAARYYHCYDMNPSSADESSADESGVDTDLSESDDAQGCRPSGPPTHTGVTGTFGAYLHGGWLHMKTENGGEDVFNMSSQHSQVADYAASHTLLRPSGADELALVGPDCTVLLLELQPAGRDEVAGHPAPPIKRAECALVGKGTQLTLAWSPCGRWVLAGGSEGCIEVLEVQRDASDGHITSLDPHVLLCIAHARPFSIRSSMINRYIPTHKEETSNVSNVIGCAFGFQHFHRDCLTLSKRTEGPSTAPHGL